jgi:tRNA-binding EMAP/Myf-like protein
VDTKRCPTGKVLARVWKRWSAEHERQFGAKPSMRGVSMNYFDDKPDLLARWTTAVSRPHWRVPLARLEELRVTFQMSQDEVDDLVLARVQELDDDEEARVLVAQVVDIVERVSTSDEERQVVAAWRKVRPNRLLGLDISARGSQDLEKLFDGLLRVHERRQAAERAADPPEELADVERATLTAKAQAVVKKMAAKRPKTLSPRAQVRELLHRIRAP